MDWTRTVALALLALWLVAATPSSPIPIAEPKPEVEESEFKQEDAETNQSPLPPTVFTPDASRESPQPSHTERGKRSQTLEPEDASQWWFTFFLVVFTALLVAVGAGQACLLSRQANVQKDALLQQRAWIVPTGQARIGGNPASHVTPGLISIAIYLRNAGHAPARSVTIRVAWSISQWSDPLPGGATFSDDDITTVGAIGPGVVHVHWGAIGPFVGPEFVGVFETGQSRLTVYGLVEYSDHFGRPHETKFCVMWWGPEFPAAAPDDWSIAGPYNDCT